MATTSFSESFKYGSRLFGFFLAILVVGAGMVGGGAYLAVPEIQAWLDTGSAETALIAGGLVVGVVGLAVLIIGQFALLYKLIADGVSRGNADPAVDLAVGPAEDDTAEADDERESEASTAESAGVAESPEQPAEPDQSQEPAVEDEPQPAPDQPPAEASAEPAEQSTTDPQDAGETGREQTAEEIVFGSSDESTADSAESEPEEDTGDFEFDEEPESRESVETAGNPSSDPLADNFDDE